MTAVNYTRSMIAEFLLLAFSYMYVITHGKPNEIDLIDNYKANLNCESYSCSTSIFAMKKKFSVFSENRRHKNRQLQVDEINYLKEGYTELRNNIPATFLFIDDIVSYTDELDNVLYVSQTNPVQHSRFSYSQGYNTFKVQPASIQSTYKNRILHQEQNFTVQTWNLLFPTPGPTNSDPENHNIFAFKNVDVGNDFLNSLLESGTEYRAVDIFWCVYFSADTTLIKDELTQSPSIFGMDNIVVFSEKKLEGGKGIYLDSTGVSWTTFSHPDVDRDTLSIQNIFMIYGSSIGTKTDLTTSSILTVFFDNVQAIPESLNSNNIDYATKGISIIAVNWFSASTLSSYLVSYTGNKDSIETAYIYNPLYFGRIELEIAEEPEASWSIVFGFDGGTAADLFYPMIGFQNKNGYLVQLSARGNGNKFGPGGVVTQKPNYLYAKTSKTLSGILASASAIQNIYNGISSNRPNYAAWLEFSTAPLVGTTVSTGAFQMTNSKEDFSIQKSSGGFAGFMFCSTYDYGDLTFELKPIDKIGESSFPNYYGCWSKLQIYDQYCSICNIDGWTKGTYESPQKITINNLIIPLTSGLSLPMNSITSLFNNYGTLINSLDLYYAGDLFEINQVSILTPDLSINRGSHSEKLQFQLQTNQGIPEGSVIILQPLPGSVATSVISTQKDADVDCPCFIVDQLSTMSCTFNWKQTEVSIYIDKSINQGTFYVELFGLFADSDIPIDIDKQYIDFSVLINNANSSPIYESPSNQFIRIKFGFNENTISITEMHWDIENIGWNTNLWVTFETDKRIYQGDYFILSLENSEDLNNENNECLVWDDSGKISTSYACKINTLAEIIITPLTNGDQHLTNVAITFSISNIVVPESNLKRFVYANIYYNGKVLGLISEPMFLPDLYSSHQNLTSLSVNITEDYIGVPSLINFKFQTTASPNLNSYILVAFSHHYQLMNTFNYDLFVSVNNIDCYAEIQDSQSLLIWGNFSLNSMNIDLSIYGIRSPNLYENDNRTFYIGLMQNINSTQLSQIGKVEYFNQTYNLSSVDILYPRFESFNALTTREIINYTMYWEPKKSYDAKMDVRISLTSVGWSIIKASNISCTFTPQNSISNYASSCTQKGNVLFFTLNQKIIEGVMYKITLYNFLTPDWSYCNLPKVEMQLWNQSTLIGISSIAIADKQQINLYSYDYSLEILNYGKEGFINLPIGFYSSFYVSTSIGIFKTQIKDISLSLGSSKNFLQYNSTTSKIGFTYLNLMLGIPEETIEGSWSAVFDANTNNKIAQLPTVLFNTVLYKSSIIINSNHLIDVPAGGSSYPISICLENPPINEHSFNITTNSSNLIIDQEMITLNHEKTCAWIILNASENAEYGEKTTLYVQTLSPLFSVGESAVSISNPFSPFISLNIKLWIVDDNSLTTLFSANSRCLVILYVEPTNLFNQTFTTESALLGQLSGEISRSDGEFITISTIIQNSESDSSFYLKDLMKNIDYSYVMMSISDSGIQQILEGNFETTDSKNTTKNVKVLTITFDDALSTISNYSCDLGEYFGLPIEDIAFFYNDTFINCADEDSEILSAQNLIEEEQFKILQESNEEETEEGSEEELEEEFGEEFEEEFEEEMNDLNSTDNSSNSQKLPGTVLTVMILPPLRSWVDDYVNIELDLDLLTIDLQNRWSKKIVSILSTIHFVVDVYDATVLPNFDANESYIQIEKIVDKNLTKQQGLIYYIVYKDEGQATNITYSDIKYGLIPETVFYGSRYLKEFDNYTINITDLPPVTYYGLAYYVTSFDTRAYVKRSQLFGTSFITPVYQIPEEAVAEEEEFSLLVVIKFTLIGFSILIYYL